MTWPEIHDGTKGHGRGLKERKELGLALSDELSNGAKVKPDKRNHD